MTTCPNKQVLYLVDDQDHYELVRHQLHSRGIEVTSARAVADAVKAAALGLFDLYLLDNAAFADGTGQDACRRIRSLDPNIPILFYSGRAYPREVECALAAGANDYITLPDINCVLSDRVSALLCLADMRSQEARREEVRAISSDLKERFTQTEEVAEMVEVSQAERQFLRARSSLMFLRAGGTRADFERMWPEILEEAVDRSWLTGIA